MKVAKPVAEADRRPRTKKETVALGSEKLSAYAGTFSSEELLAKYTIGVRDGKLAVLSIQSGDGFVHPARNLVMRSVGIDKFAADQTGLEFSFQRNEKGTVSGFSLDAGRTKGLAFQRK
jgi:hypothetical protein